MVIMVVLSEEVHTVAFAWARIEFTVLDKSRFIVHVKKLLSVHSALHFEQGFLDSALHLILLNLHECPGLIFCNSQTLVYVPLCMWEEWESTWLTFIQYIFKKDLKWEIAVDPKPLSQGSLFL